MNTYEERQEAKREGLRAAAAKRREASDARYSTARAIGSMIPMGQPVLVGHHSERGHRAALSKIDSNMRKSIELDKEARTLEQRADAVGTGGISSDDPEAVAKLTDKLAKLQEKKAQMLAHNKNARATGGQTIPGFYFTNMGATIRATQKRIDQLTAQQTREAAPDIVAEWYTVREDIEDNRLLFITKEKPGEEVRGNLKRYGFKWSPTRGAWVRQLTPNARYSLKLLLANI